MIRAAIVGIGTWGRNLVAGVQGKSDVIRFVAGATRTPAKAADFSNMGCTKSRRPGAMPSR